MMRLMSTRVGGAIILFLCAVLASLASTSQQASAETCPSGAEVADVKYCDYFYLFKDRNTPADDRITHRLNITPPLRGRSIALIIAIGDYPNYTPLRAAENDLANLKGFLKDDQKFDEIIVLQDKEATRDNIDYFLRDYLPQQGAEYGQKGRFLFAYSGHGTNTTPTTPPRLLLSDTTGPLDSAHSYDLNDLRQRLENLANGYFHVLALINACWGGAIFKDALGGGNPSDGYQPGALAITAGSDDSTVASKGQPGDGSIFFDSIIDGVRTGIADQSVQQTINRDGKAVRRGGIIRLGSLASYLQEVIENINDEEIEADDGSTLRLSTPWIGSVEPPNQVAKGGFFFLGPIQFAKTPDASGSLAFDLPDGPISSVPGRPDLKVFLTPEDYPIRGIDVSRYNGPIGWPAVKAQGYTFAYIRGLGSAGLKGLDPQFAANWAGSAAAGVDRGIYNLYDYCLTPHEQYEKITSAIPRDDTSLPMAIDIEPPFLPQQVDCLRQTPLEKRSQAVADLAQGLRQFYGKVPIIYSTTSELNRIVESIAPAGAMIWLAKYKATLADGPNLAIKGENPWTLWQYTDEQLLPGIGHRVDANVFFGTPDQYTLFKNGRVNAALDVARRVLPQKKL